MAGQSSLDAKEQIRHAVDIVDLVGDYLQLRREGRIYKALCPWHDDSRPSLQVNPERQSFRCWVCDIGGDIFSFVMKIEGVDFAEALTMLAERAGVALERRSGAQAGSRDDKRLWYQAMAWAEQQYHQALLNSPEAEPARRYLSERQIPIESWRRWHLGYAPRDRHWLGQRARETPYTTAVLETVDLLSRTESGELYERFRGRVLFSIRDPQGRPVAFGGRLLPGMEQTSPAKYVNSRETPLFTKSEMVYGLDLARDAITKPQPDTGLRTAIVMEGYTDCIMAHQFGFTHALAVLGTALGPRHIRLLKRFADRVVLVLDGDQAGQTRSSEILELFVAEEVDLRVLTLPDQADPCEFLLERGADELRVLLSQAVDALEHRLRLAVAKVSDPSNTHAAHQAMESVLGTLAKSPRLVGITGSAAQLREDQVLHQLSARFGVSESALRSRLSALRRAQRSASRRSSGGLSATDSAAVAQLRISPGESLLLEVLLQDPGALPEIRNVVSPDDLPTADCRRLLERCFSLYDSGEAPTFERLLLEFDDPQMKSLLVRHDESGRAKHGAEFASVLRQLLADYRARAQRRAAQTQMSALAGRGLNETQEQEVLQQLIEAERSRRGISQPTEG